MSEMNRLSVLFVLVYVCMPCVLYVCMYVQLLACVEVWRKCVRLFAICPVSHTVCLHCVSYVQRFWEPMPEDLKCSVMETVNTSLLLTFCLCSSLPSPPAAAAFAKIRCSSWENGELLRGVIPEIMVYVLVYNGR